ncbi:MAG: PEGA domain-containing protein [Acidobacteriia bacterium]|nr:PEGA domain-containing protein [Terriglobia bacterium]
MRRKSYLVVFLIALAMAACSLATAGVQRGHPRPAKRGVVVFVGGYFYDPFFGPYPWWPRVGWPHPYYPLFDEPAELRLQVTPKDAAVYVDGYYAGVVDDFDGIFQRLRLPPGPHELTFFLQGFRTAHQRLYLAPNSDSKVRLTLERLAPGEMSAPPPVAAPVPPPPPGTARSPRTPPRLPVPPPAIATPPAAEFGSVSIRVQPADADVTIDGERWTGSEGDRLVVQLAEGTHRVEIQKPGFRRFSTEIQVRRGETTPLNVSLSPEGPPR